MASDRSGTPLELPSGNGPHLVVSRDDVPRLTARQLEVVRLVARGHSNREIASLLHVSESGVKAHIARLLVKFGAPNRAALVRIALPRSGGADASMREAYDALSDTLTEVIGRTAAEVLLRRALRRACSQEPGQAATPTRASAERDPVQWWNDGRRDTEDLRAVMRELWALLTEASGPVVVARLERRGFVPDASRMEGSGR